MAKNGHSRDAERDPNGLEVCSHSIEGQRRGIAGRLSAAAQVDEYEPAALAHLRWQLPLVRLCADGARHEADGTRPA